MSISGSLSNALSGMTAAGRAAQVVSSNVANALTEGYGRQVLETSSRVLGSGGAGVQVDGITRVVDQQILADRRQSDAEAGYADTQSNFYTSLEAAIGLPGEPGSLSGRLDSFESALIAASSRPDTTARLDDVLNAATALQGHITGLSNKIQSLRMQADQEIGAQVDLLNDRLGKITDLNNQIRRQTGGGGDASALMDQRQKLVDDISAIVPVRQAQRDYGQIALYTTNGATLIDGKAAEFSFAPVGTIVPEMTFSSGALSGLQINGHPVSTSSDHGPVAGGSLAALFDQRDSWAVDAQRELDALTRDLVERFQAGGLDPTLSVDQAGLFTDGAAAFLPMNEVGLSSRLRVNPVVDPDQGGATWRLRDGLGSAAPGSVGNATLLNAFSAALTESRTVASGGLAGISQTGPGLASEFLSIVSSARVSADAEVSYTHAKNSALRTAELENGVDTDQELQSLLLIEQAYSANARVVQTVDDMIQTLLGI